MINTLDMVAPLRAVGARSDHEWTTGQGCWILRPGCL